MRLHRSEHLLGAALFVLLAVRQQCVSADPNILAPPEVTMQNGTMYAACKLRPINSLPDAVHIHQYGDLGQECKAAGGHYNPRDEHHPNHPGDFGNFQPQGGKIHMLMEMEATLFGGLSVIGRAVVVHEKMDDLGLGGDEGSLLNGNAGRRIGCCVIGIYPATLWNMYHEQLQNNLLRGN
ncbi:unnamed protein product [Pleuronectes platessa]|uniref:Superoxide dismutase [Cu-Zn] n=1 Tax=Pleuronectes platessa TaxID=8262 RepID=A0A9N7YNQ7_PLEPL|nr:unnamed protein product [Pleuronectes platessa]